MKLLITTEKLSKLKCRDSVPMECDYCNHPFTRPKNEVKRFLKEPHCNRYCSSKCRVNSTKRQIECKCDNCDTTIFKRKSFMDSKNNFCSYSCNCSYHNKHKTYGINRSKLELWIEKHLKLIYPKLDIVFSERNIIDGELDIYIPSLKLAFELNGIFHYKQIFGKKQFEDVTKKDQEKLNECISKNIKLVIIDITSQKYFKEKTSQIFLNMIINYINESAGC